MSLIVDFTPKIPEVLLPIGTSNVLFNEIDLLQYFAFLLTVAALML